MLIGSWLQEKNGQFAFLPWRHPERVANGQFIEIGVYALGGARIYRDGNHAHHPRAVLHVPHLTPGIGVRVTGVRGWRILSGRTLTRMR